MLWSPARLTGGRQCHRKEVFESMTGAMYAAIGGLKSHMTKLNVIGNNVANVNTYGYKASRMTFKESMYTTSRSGSNGGATSGGNNPSQVGYGCSVGSIDLNMSPSTYAPTGQPMDTYIDGEGFYLVGDKLMEGESGIRTGEDLKKPDLTRVGDFWIDPDGYVCNRDGKVLYGFARVQNPEYDPTAQKPADGATDEEIAEYNRKISPTIISTELVPLRAPLSAAAPTEANGGLTGAGTADEKRLWEEGDPVYPYLSAEEGGINKYAKPSDKADPDAKAGSTQIAVAQNTAADRVSDVIQVQLEDVGIGKNGAITGTAANGQTVVIGYVAIATPDSPDGVTHINGPYYKCLGGAGNLRVSTLGVELPCDYLGNKTADLTGADAPTANDAILINKNTQLIDGGLEASSTDVANEFADMITTQRGYQANTRIITVTDSMLEELVNMKR